MRHKIKLLAALLFSVAAFALSCTKTSEDLLVSPVAGGCDTLDVKYSVEMKSILETHCYSCHGNGSTGGSGGILLEGYSNLKKWADNGFLVGNVTHAAGYVPMPYGQPKLGDCEVNTIVAWVNQGALNN